MSELAKITGAPAGTINVNGKDYPFHPMTFTMIAEYETFCITKYLDKVEAVLAVSKAGESFKEKRREDAALMAERLRFGVTYGEDAEAAKIMRRIEDDLEGTAMLTWLAIRDSEGHPTLAEVSAWILDSAMKRLALRRLSEANGVGKKLKGGGAAAKPLTSLRRS